MADHIRRRVAASSAPGLQVHAALGSWAKHYPALAEFLSLSEWEPGVPRATGSMSLFVDAGSWKCCLSDRDSSHVAFVSAPEAGDLLAAVEKALRADSLDWRPMRERGGKGRK